MGPSLCPDTENLTRFTCQDGDQQTTIATEESRKDDRVLKEPDSTLASRFKAKPTLPARKLAVHAAAMETLPHRLFLVLASLAGILAIATAQEVCLNLTSSPTLAQFVDPVPVLPRVSLRGSSTTRPVTIGAYRIQQKLHRDLPPTTVYAFGTSARTATVPGPTLVARRGVASHVRWVNNITDASHLFVIDPTIDRAQVRSGVPLVVHLHGGETPPAYDGHPDTWYTNGGERGPNFTTNVFTYPNSQPPTLLWYHDHSFGYTRLSVAAGLAGLYLITARERPAWLPQLLADNHQPHSDLPNAYVHDLVLQDRQFFANGSVIYPTVGSNPAVHPNWCADYFGDTILVNGKAWPFLNVSRGVHRFRLVNGGNSRFYVLNLNNPNLRFVKIGTDGGFLSTPVGQTTLGLAPSERADFLLDFSSLTPGQNVTVTNTATSILDPGMGMNRSVIMFRVVGDLPPLNVSLPTNVLQLSNQTVPGTINATTGIDLSTTNLTGLPVRRFVLGFDNVSQSFHLNPSLTFRSPVTELIQLYRREIWEFVSTADHPIHIHLINFFVLNQQKYNDTAMMNNACSLDVPYPNPSSCYLGNPLVAEEDQLGWKDTAVVRTKMVTRFFLRFRPRDEARFSFDPTAMLGYVWHCHILEHEDNEMMRPLLFRN